MAELEKQKLFAIDTETTSIVADAGGFGGNQFFLAAEDRVSISRFGAPMGAKRLSLAKVREKLAPILADKTIKKIGQNIKYDMLVLRNAGLAAGGRVFRYYGRLILS